MASYLETQLRKQRHSKSIVKRNNDRRQLLLKQQPDVGDVATETSGEDVPVEHRSYWEDDESDGYDPRIRWIRGPEGAFYYDGRAGVRTFGDDIPEGFISEREFNNITAQFAELLDMPTDDVGDELQNAESPLSVSWQAAVQGNPTPEGGYVDLIGASFAELIARTHNISPQEAGRRLTTSAQTMRRDQIAALAEDGEYTTGYVRETIRQADREEVERLQDGFASEAPPQPIEPTTPSTSPTPYEEVGVSKTVFDSLSPWGQASLSSSSIATNNYSLYRSFPDVWLSDAGDAVVPSKHTQAGVTVTSKTRGTALKKNTKYLADLVIQANGDVDTHNRRILKGYLTSEGREWRDIGDSIIRFFRDDSSTKSIKEVVREDGVPEEIVSQLKERAVLYTFEEWMKLRDTLWKRGLRRANNQQEVNKEQYGTYVPQRVKNFEEKGTGVVGSATKDWIRDHSSHVKEAYTSYHALFDLKVPSSAKVWPPVQSDLSPKDGIEFTSALQSRDSESNVRNLVTAWFDYNVKRLSLTDPVKAQNEHNWGFAAGRVESAAADVVNNRHRSNSIMSVANDGTIGAALDYFESDYGNWSVSSAGTSPKGFSSWPVNEIAAALESAVDEAGHGVPRMEQRRNPLIRNLRTLLSNWNEQGLALPSDVSRGMVDRGHAIYVFFEFASRFLRKGGKSASTSGISDYVRDYYKRFGFADGRDANRLNILWTLATFPGGGSYIPRAKNEETGEDEGVISKSFGTRLNKVAYTEKHDTIKTDNTLNALQDMLDNLMKKADERYGFTDKKLAQANEQEIKDLQDNFEMSDEELEEYLEGFMYMLAGTGPIGSQEKG